VYGAIPIQSDLYDFLKNLIYRLCLFSNFEFSFEITLRKNDSYKIIGLNS